ncbi:MAG TPA: hypothetical protein VF338_10935 [Leptolinea sp.]
MICINKMFQCQIETTDMKLTGSRMDCMVSPKTSRYEKGRGEATGQNNLAARGQNIRLLRPQA